MEKDLVVFNLHPKQLEVFKSPARFKVVVAGRRSGKSYLAAVMLLIEALRDTNIHGQTLIDTDVLYVSPTMQQSRDIMWSLIKRLGKQVITAAHENTMAATLLNGRKIHLRGSDRPEGLRGVGLSYVVLDEYALIKAEAWEMIIRPTLADKRGGALFISTPAGKNHLYDLYTGHGDIDPEWQNFTFTSNDNPYIETTEIEAMRKRMSHAGARQELDAQFESGGGQILDPEDLKPGHPKNDAPYYLSVDLAGFSDSKALSRLSSRFRKLDRHAICCVQVSKDGWYVDDVIYGRYDVREVSLRILRAAKKYRPVAIGIERGALKNAVLPYIQDQSRRLNVFPNIVETTHGGKKKADRITWALQGRLQQHRITYREGGAWVRALKDEMVDFPSPMAHDDLLDALSYTDQIATTVYNKEISDDTFQPLDSLTGY